MTTEEFRKLSAVAALLIPHDAARLTLRSPDGLDAHLFSNTDGTDPNAGGPVLVCAYTQGGSPTAPQFEAVFKEIGAMVGRQL